jgi:predicted small lipoprotein YifL
LTRAVPTVLVLAALAMGLQACGRRAPLDVPQTFDQATPGTAADAAARNPARDAQGNEIAPTRMPSIRPAADSFILDPLLR